MFVAKVTGSLISTQKVASMKGFFHGDATFAFSLRTVIGFAVGCLAGWLFWKFVRSRMAKPKDS